MREIKLFINGEMRDSSEALSFDSLNPATGDIVAKCHLPSKQDIEDAITAAHHAFYNREWRDLKAHDRAGLLAAIGEKIKERKNELIELEVQDSGSILRKAKADIHNSASFFKVMSKVAQNFSFETRDENASRAGFSTNSRQYTPIGVCAQIIPWNFPLVMAAWKIAPVLATGCTSVLKTAQETPVTAMILAEILQQVGVPKGVINIITGGAEVGSQLVSHPKISKVAFTGSTQVGREILKAAAETIKVSTLELGGKSANIILEDADLDVAVDGALYAYLYHSGQACDSGTRLLVQENIYSEFIKRFNARIKEVKIGPTSDITTGFGPVINEKQFNTVMNYIETTKKEGAKLICGGKRLIDGELAKGYYIAPTAFEITPDNTIWKEEIFGPVVGITTFKTEAEAIDLANRSDYGLAAAVWSKDHERANKIARELEAGTVWINEYHLLNPGMPFGGYKQSGLGREMGEEGIKAYLQVKHIWESDCDERTQKPWFDALF